MAAEQKEKQQFEFDVFISYSTKDEQWVIETLLPRLEQDGVKVCIDFRDFKPGWTSLHNIQHGVRHSRHTLLVITENWFSREWTVFESFLSGTNDPTGMRQRTIPLLLRKSEPPETADFITALSYVDFTRPDRAEFAWRMLFNALGVPQEPRKQTTRDNWYLAHPYPMPPHFTGRNSERQMLSEWIKAGTDQPLLVLRALGGFGKSALTWHWLTHDIPREDWPRVVWWSFYESDASFEAFLDGALNHLSDGEINPSALSPRSRLAELLRLLRPGTLLVLDGFERELRAFGGIGAAYQGDEVLNNQQAERECVSPLAGLFLRSLVTLPGIHAKVLLTTRLRPREVEGHGGFPLQGCEERELSALHPSDAVAFFQAQGIRGTQAEIRAACEPYGYHPLSLCLLAGVIVHDLQQPRDIAATKRLNVSGSLVQRQHHVLETAYKRLTPEQQTLIGRIACFRGPVNYDLLKVLSESATVTLNADLKELITVGLLHHDTTDGRFDLHPIVRRFAYDRLAAPDRAAAHTRLRDYFAAVPATDKVTRLEELAPMVELYHHTVRAGQLDEAGTLFRDRLATPLYYQFGAYQLRIDLLRPLFPDGEDRPPRLKDEGDQAWTLNSLANSYSLSGQPRRAVPLFEGYIAISEKRGDKKNLAIGLGNVAYMAQLHIGTLRAAEANLRRSIVLCQEIKDEFWEAAGDQELGHLLAYRGADAESETELATALKMFERQNYVPGQGIAWAYRASRELLWQRNTAQSATSNPQSAIESARRALALADEYTRTDYPIERNYVQAHWLVGASRRVAGQLDEAERHLHEALERCRRINLVEFEADILIDLARLSVATGAADEAQRLAEEARLIAERSSYVLQGADAHLELARLALARHDRVSARDHAQKARTLATCDGPPDYTYKAAYDEAGALLKQLS